MGHGRSLFYMYLIVLTSCCYDQAQSFSHLPSFRQQNSQPLQATRRDFVTTATALIASTPAYAAGDLTSQLFNEDGSLKQDIATEATSRTVQGKWTVSDILQKSVDEQFSNSEAKESVTWQYVVPGKWSDGKTDTLYMDRTEGVDQKGCEAIYVYQMGENVPPNLLEKATTIGVPKALALASVLGNSIEQADLIAGRTRITNDSKYYEFDLGQAPSTCENSAENLGLGFCPFEALYLVVATIQNDKLYVLVVQSGKNQWKRGSNDLKRVRSSFVVTNN